eukprot:15335365-Ditylum_brightwellii.AAC.1
MFNKFKIKISFTIPKDNKIKPCDKFATLFSIIQQQYKDTLLKQWDAEAAKQAQSIIAKADIPYKREKLSIYCPLVWRNTRLDTQWRLNSMACYYDIKTNRAILEHIMKHSIYMNPTEIKQVETTVAGFFVYSHTKYHSRRDAAAEISARVNLEGFDLHVHTCRYMQQRHTKVITISCGRQEVQDVKGKLADGSITEQHIALMVRKQNIYLRDEMAISATGFCQINSIITVPGTATELSFHCWLLSVKTVDKSMPLFSAIEKDPNE